jgi:DNA-binding XRE family transcriptional regulator
MRSTKQTLFKPTRAESKLSTTDTAARLIVRKETEARSEKSRRLREMRLAKEAALPDETAAPAKTGKKKARPTRRAAG